MKILRWVLFLLTAFIIYLGISSALSFLGSPGWTPLIVTIFEVGWFFGFVYIITMKEESSYQ